MDEALQREKLRTGNQNSDFRAIPFKVLPFSPVVLCDRQEKRDVVRGTGAV